MPNTKSAERRARSSVRKHTRNRSVKSRLGTLEKAYLDLVGAGKKDEAAAALRGVSSALDKAAKTERSAASSGESQEIPARRAPQRVEVITRNCNQFVWLLLARNIACCTQGAH
jgi:ribosomal protein S20